MALTFDATLKDLVRGHPADFLSGFDSPPTLPVSLLNVDLSTVTTTADVLMGLGEPLREVIHLDFQSSANATKHLDVLVYNALLHRQYQVPVHSIVVLLRPQAAHSNTDGTVRYQARPGRGKMDFGYEVVRLWEKPASELLVGALGMLPLAPLGKLPEGVSVTDGLAEVIQQLIERLQREAPAEEVRRLLTAAFLLTGLRVRSDVAMQLFQGVRAMHDSDTYQFIVDEGRLAEVKRILLRQGRIRFGPPDESVQAILAGQNDLDHLEGLTERILHVDSWQELLASP